MAILNIDIETADLLNCGWENALASAEGPTIDSFAEACRKLRQQRENDAEAESGAALQLLTTAGFMFLRPGRKEGSLATAWNDKNGAPIAPTSFSEREIDHLIELANVCGNAEIVARVFDIDWESRRNHVSARAALNAYLEASNSLETLGEYSEVWIRLERALELATQLEGKEGELSARVLSVIRDVVLGRTTDLVTTKTTNLLELLIDRNHGNATDLANLATDFAQSLEGRSQFHEALHFWRCAVAAYRAHDAASARVAQIRAAECYVSEAEKAPMEMMKVGLLQKAIRCYRDIPHAKDRRDELHARLLGHQENIRAEMGTVGTTIDLGDWPDEARNTVHGLDFIDALNTLAFMLPVSDRDEVTKEVLERAKTVSPLELLIPQVQVNDKGRTIGTAPGLLDNADAAVDAAVHREMIRHYQYDIAAVLEPARLEIISENPSLTETDLLSILNENDFVPQDRRLQFARGLLAGFKSDFLQAAVYILPQIENSLRVLLHKAGVITSGLNASDFRQNEHSLNVLLDRHAKELEEILGSDIVFELQNLLINPMGSNLRNEAMHGLLSDNDFFSYAVFRIWWLVLRICCQFNPSSAHAGSS